MRIVPLNPDAIDYKKVFKRLNETGDAAMPDDSENISAASQNPEALRVLENLIGKDKLELFNSQTTSDWTGRREDKSLFEIWFKLANGTTFADVDNDDGMSNSSEVSCTLG